MNCPLGNDCTEYESCTDDNDFDGCPAYPGLPDEVDLTEIITGDWHYEDSD